MQKIVVIANGAFGDAEFYRRQIREKDYIICADGGLRHALAMGICPHLVIGDGDSLSTDLRCRLEQLNLDWRQYREINQEKSDLEFALDYAVTLRPEEIVIYGALGGERVDHEFINILLLTIPLNKGICSKIIDEQQEIQLMNRELAVAGRVGDYLSLFALTPVATGVVTEGLKYPLHKETLYFASSRGLSNEFTGTEARITVESGLLLAVKNNRQFGA